MIILYYPPPFRKNVRPSVCPSVTFFNIFSLTHLRRKPVVLEVQFFFTLGQKCRLVLRTRIFDLRHWEVGRKTRVQNHILVKKRFIYFIFFTYYFVLPTYEAKKKKNYPEIFLDLKYFQIRILVNFFFFPLILLSPTLS